MVLFVDLEDESESEPPESGNAFKNLNLTHRWGRDGEAGLMRSTRVMDADGRDNPNKNAITQALGCYPYALLLSSQG